MDTAFAEEFSPGMTHTLYLHKGQYDGLTNQRVCALVMV
jgi:hypothetical protein